MASNDLRGQNDYAYLTVTQFKEGSLKQNIAEIFAVKAWKSNGQTDGQTLFRFIYIDGRLESLYYTTDPLRIE